MTKLFNLLWKSQVKTIARSAVGAIALSGWLVVGGCNTPSGSPAKGLVGPARETTVAEVPWSYRDNVGLVVSTQNYRIHTTIDETPMRGRLAQLMQGAIAEYGKMVPGLTLSDRPMDCYVFNNRREWATFTKLRTGADADIYLQINRGGYTIRDWYVAYKIGEYGTYAVAAHEGWHQFVARHFVDRLPPFLEEGIATQFENISWDGDLPRWDLQTNVNRAARLRAALEKKYLFQLDKLVSMHAGDVVGLNGERIEAFYAQNWAFVRFCRDAEGGRYRPVLEALLTDAARGQLYKPRGTPPLASMGWNPKTVKPMLEHYFGTDLATIEKAYLAYVRVLAVDRFSDQWTAMGR